MHKAVDLDGRRAARLALLDRQLQMQPNRRGSSPPRSCCRCRRCRDRDPRRRADPRDGDQGGRAPRRRPRARPERALGRTPVEQAFNNPGFDILSQRDGEDPIRIEVKARIDGADGLLRHPQRGADRRSTAVPRYRLALVRVDPRGARARRGPLPREPVRRLRPRRLRRDRPPRQVGHDLGARPGAVLDADDDRSRRSRRRGSAAEAQADRGGAAAGDDQPRVGAGEVDPPRPPVDAAPVVGAPAARRRSGGAVRPARRRPVLAPRSVPDRGAAARRARAAARHHRAARRLGEHRATRRCSPRRTPRSCKSTGGNPPPILDPFAGGGTIPLEAQRLGLEAHASDLNPVAVLINKALIEIPPKFAGPPPVFPGLADVEIRRWEGAKDLPPTCARTASGCATRRRGASASTTPGDAR